MGIYHDEPVLLMEPCIGKRTLSFNFCPTTNKKNKPYKKSKVLENRMMVEGAHKDSANIEKFISDFQLYDSEESCCYFFSTNRDDS